MTNKPVTEADIESIARAIDVEYDVDVIYRRIQHVEATIGDQIISGNAAFRLLLKQGYRSKAIEFWRHVTTAWNHAVKAPQFKVELRFTGRRHDFAGASLTRDVYTQLTRLIEEQYPGVQDFHCTVELVSPR